MSEFLDAARAAAVRIVELGTSSGATVATAESLTGGMVGEIICTVPGASATYMGGVISYAYSVKEKVLGVDGELLASRGAVDEEVARQMATGTARVCEADYGVATTGVAGPEPHGGKAVGTVVLGIKTPTKCFALVKHYDGDRQEIREQAARDALVELAKAMEAE